MKLLGLGDNVMDAYLFRGELYPGGNAANVAVLAKRAGAEKTKQPTSTLVPPSLSCLTMFSKYSLSLKSS